jgi:hypothetical protein
MPFIAKLKQKISSPGLAGSKRKYLVVFSLVLFFIFCCSHNANAGVVGEVVGAVADVTIMPVIKLLLKAVLSFCSVLLSMAETIFEWIVDPQNMKEVMDNDIVYGTWRTVRDVFNIAFIMVLLFSAFATIFQTPANFNYKKILINLVIMALLINFSYPIARFIADASNIMMFGFLNNLGGTNSFMTLIDQSGLSSILSPKDPEPLYLISAIIFTFIFAITLLVIAVLLVIRTIAMTIYIIFSPIAFIGPIMPGTGLASTGDEWWKDFMKYCFSGPTMIFMLYIASTMFKAVASAQLHISNIAVAQVPGSVSNPELTTLISKASFLSIPIVILWLGIIQAQKSGIAGAAAVVGVGTKALKWSGKHLTGYSAAKYGTKALAKKVDRDYIGARAAIQAWNTRSDKVDKDKVSSQAAKWRDRWDNLPVFFDKGKRDPHYHEKIDDESKILEYKKEQDLFSGSDAEVVVGVKKLVSSGKKDKETGQRIQAFLRTMAERKDLNEFEKKQGLPFDPFDAKEHIYEVLKGNVGEEGAVDALHDLEDINLSNGVYSMYGLTTYVEKAETYDAAGNVLTGQKGDSARIRTRRKSTKEEQKVAAMAKAKNIDFQKFMINFHPDSAIQENPDGSAKGLNDIGEEMIRYIESRGAKYADRMRGDAKEKLLTAIRKSDRDNGTNLEKECPELIKALNISPPAPKPQPAGEANTDGGGI